MGYPTTEIRLENGGDLLTIGAAATVTVENGATITGLTGATTFASSAEVKAGVVTDKVIAPDTLLAALTAYPTPIISLQTIATAALGTVRQVHGQLTASHGAIASGTLAAVRGLVTLSGVNSAGGAYLYGAQGKLVVTGTMNHADSRLCALIAQVDTTGGTLTAGQLSGLWVDMLGIAGAGGGQYNAIRVTAAAGIKPNALLYFQGDASFFADMMAPSGGAQSFVVAAGTGAGSAGAATGVASKVMKIQLASGDTYYLPLFAANT